MNVTGLLELLKPYGLVGIVIALMSAAIVALYLQLTKALKTATDRADRLEQEVKLLNQELQRTLMILPRTADLVNVAATMLRTSNDPAQPES